MKYLLMSLSIFICFATKAQMGIGISTPAQSAELDVTSTSKGFLQPRMTQLERNLIVSPKEGLMVYCTDCGSTGQAQIFTLAGWVNMVGNSPALSTTIEAIITVTSPTGKIWMDRNLGATQVTRSYSNAASFGDLYQWGRKNDGHQLRNSLTTNILCTNAKFIVPPDLPFNWCSTNDNVWEGVNALNNPCPSGFRLPTILEFQAELQLFSYQNTLGAMASVLRLAPAGHRTYQYGEVQPASNPTGSIGNGSYWTSNTSYPNANYLYFDETSAYITTRERASGLSVRCIKD